VDAVPAYEGEAGEAMCALAWTPSGGGGRALGLLAAARAGDALIWGCVLVGVVLALGVFLLWLRRKYHPAYGRQDTERRSFSIEDLEVLRSQGQISEAEFRRLRRKVLGLDAPAEDRDNPMSSGAGEDDDA